MNEKELVDFIQKCIAEDKIYKFYKRKEWKKLKKEILKKEHFECEMCRAKGKYTRATLVHHVNYVRKHPNLALSCYYYFNGVKLKNLVALCHDCHEKIHDRLNANKTITNLKFHNTERW